MPEEALFTLEISVRKIRQDGPTATEDSIVVNSHNLSLEEVKEMRAGLLGVLDAFNKGDAV